jgi:hypothetical protein
MAGTQVGAMPEGPDGLLFRRDAYLSSQMGIKQSDRARSLAASQRCRPE